MGVERAHRACWRGVNACRIAILPASLPPTSAPTQTPGGLHEALLRSMCQFVNDTDMALEVSLLEAEEDAAWTMVPAARGASGSGASIGEVGGARMHSGALGCVIWRLLCVFMGGARHPSPTPTPQPHPHNNAGGGGGGV